MNDRNKNGKKAQKRRKEEELWMKNLEKLPNIWDRNFFPLIFG